MFVWEGAHRAVERIAGWPLVDTYLRRQYDRRFEANRDANLFRGVFDTFDAAAKSAPPTLPLGYDHPGPAAMYLDRARKTYPTDYPMLFWLQKLLARGCTRFFDLGGHIGVSYYAYRRYLDYPAAMQWRVHDVPAVMEQGKRVASERDREKQLGFAERFEEADGMEVLMAQGSVQYLPETLAERLARLEAPPGHVLLNLTPLHERHSYFTLQGIGTAYCPYRVTAVGEFLAAYDALGYKVVDTWENPDKSCPIPFHADRSLDRYHGFYFRRAA